MDVIIKEVTSLKELKTFIRFPHQLYRGNPYWVPAMTFDELNTLRRDKNPAFEHCQAKYWLAYQNDHIVGRVAATINRLHIEKWGQKYMRFGWLDFIDDPAVSAALMGTVEAWAHQSGLSAVHGPLGFTDMDREGMLIEGFNELSTLATYYNHPYYPIHMERMGYVKDTDWVEYEINVTGKPDEKIAHLSEIVLKRNKLHLLKARSKNEVLPYAKQMFHLLDETYSHLYGTVPLSPRQVDAYIKQYFDFIIPGFVPIILDENDKVVAFGISMPSFSRALQKSRGELFPFGFVHMLLAMQKNDRVDLYLVAIKSEYQGKGLNAPLMNQLHETLIKFGITKAESNPELETNISVRAQWRHFETRQHKRRRVFIKQIGK